MEPTIMLVDSRMENLKILEKMLKGQYTIIKCSGGQQATKHLLKCSALPNLILLDIVVPNADGFEILRVLKTHHKWKQIPVICITAGEMEQRALELGAADFISKPFDPQVVMLRIYNQILLRRHMENLEKLVSEKIQETVEARDNMLAVLADIIEYRSLESGGHVKRVAQYAQVIIGDLLVHSKYAAQIEEIGAEVIIKSVPMHDVGKIGIPDSILMKPGRLTKEEFEQMKDHTVIGKTIIDSIFDKGDDDSNFLKHCSDIAYCHHEWYDGSGYPQGLKGEEIPLSARIMAVVDVYDALITRRVYKEAFPHEKAMRMMREEAATHFDPVIVRSFVRTQAKCSQIAQKTAVSPA